MPALAAGVETSPEPVDDATLVEIFSRLRVADPEPRSELEYLNPYTLLVAVVLSAQATDKSVNLATANTPAATANTHRVPMLSLSSTA